MNVVVKKINNNRGGIATILAYILVSFLLVVFILLNFSWNIRDNTYDYISTTIKTAVDISVKRGIVDGDIKNFIIENLSKMYELEDYEITIGKQDISDIGSTNNSITKYNLKSISSSNKVSFKVGDVLYIQFKLVNEDKQPLSSKLIKMINGNDDYRYDNLLIIHQGMVEVNGE